MSSFFFLYLFFLLFVILYFAYYNTYQAEQKQKDQELTENFTTHIRRFYRPYMRRVRLYTEHFYNHAQGHMNRLLKKTGFY